MSAKNQKIKKKKNELPLLTENSSKENLKKINENNNDKNPKEDEAVKSKNTKKNTKGKNAKKKSEPPKKEEEKPKEKPKKIIETKIINELPKDHVLENKSKNTVYKLVFVFHNNDNYITVKPELKMVNLISRIAKKLNIPTDQFYLIYKDLEITEKYHSMTIKEFFNFPYNKSRPILYVKMKQNNANNTNTSNNSLKHLSAEIEKYSIFYKRSYDNKVKLQNYPSMTDINVGPNDDIYSVVNAFLKETGINSDFTCERKEEEENNNKEIKDNKDKNEFEDNKDNKDNNKDNKDNEENEENKENKENDNNEIKIIEQNANLISEYDNKKSFDENKNELNTSKNENKNNGNKIVYYIGFPAPDIAFDFNRYMNYLRLMNPTFKNVKINIQLAKKKSPKKSKLNEEESDNTKRNYKMKYNYRYGTSLNLDEKDSDKRNIEILNIVRNNFLNNKMNGLIKVNASSNYINSSSPYSTPYEERIKDYHENKKKWLSPKGFISSVNKNNGWHV